MVDLLRGIICRISGDSATTLSYGFQKSKLAAIKITDTKQKFFVDIDGRRTAILLLSLSPFTTVTTPV